jgi:hypothetical protein
VRKGSYPHAALLFSQRQSNNEKSNPHFTSFTIYPFLSSNVNKRPIPHPGFGQESYPRQTANQCIYVDIGRICNH